MEGLSPNPPPTGDTPRSGPPPETMRAAAALLLVAAACGGGAADPIVGRWANDRGKQVEFKADGRVDLPINSVEASCQDAADVIAACARRHNRWARVGGGHYRITVPAIAHRPRAASSFEPAGPCTCGSESVGVTLRGDELAVEASDERLQRLE